jgi:hypothetical protein
VFAGLGLVPACKPVKAAVAADGLLMAPGTAVVPAVLLLLLGLPVGLGLSLGEVITAAGFGEAASGTVAGCGDAAITVLLLAAVLPRVSHPDAGVAAAAITKGPAEAGGSACSSALSVSSGGSYMFSDTFGLEPAECKA